MTLGQFLLLHLMAGCGVAVAVYVTAPPSAAAGRWFQAATAVLFWPLYLPLLLARPRDTAPTDDSLDRAITQMDAELDAALQSLGGWAAGVLAREHDRLHDLRTTWVAQAERIRELDRLLS